MQCFYHEEKDAVGQCAVCGKFVCKDCARQYDNTPLMCYDCAKTGYEEWKEDARRLKRNSIIGAAVGFLIVIGTALFGKMSIVEYYASIILASVISVIIGFAIPYGMYYLKDKRLLSFFPLRVILSPFAGIIAFPIINKKIQTIISAYEMGEGSGTKDLEIQCPKCYEVYDYRINSCPKCGYNLIYRKVTK
ncbi:MAG: hypothetical protein II881_07300 [Oscillospiraceae bacterium]|nr:hypothetical protein [Oscillospiraceae bacterium]